MWNGTGFLTLLLNAGRPAPAQETLHPMLQSVAEACLDEVNAGIPAP
jgi:hypothetical protein